jgi:carbonic anhydrase
MNSTTTSNKLSIRNAMPIWGSIGACIIIGIGILFFSKENKVEHHATETNAFAKLMAGNERFSSGHPKHPDESIKHRNEISHGQHPFALIITCSDSRVSPELIFDQGLGDLFVIRTAGNLISEMELGSIEYAVEHLGIKDIIVMGHEHCGAVEAFMSHEALHGHVQTIVDSLEQETEMLPAIAHHNLDEAIKANISHQIASLAKDEIILNAAKNKNIRLKGVYYSLSSGKVLPLDSLTIH